MTPWYSYVPKYRQMQVTWTNADIDSCLSVLLSFPKDALLGTCVCDLNYKIFLLNFEKKK